MFLRIEAQAVVFLFWGGIPFTYMYTGSHVVN